MNSENTDNTTPDRPLGYWLRAVDALLTREFAAAFAGEGVTRRDWMLLNALSGDVEIPGFAERLARKGKKLRSLEDRGWIEENTDGSWTLTDEGHAAKARLGALVDGIRSRVAGAVTPEEFTTTMASLEAIARELGWDEGMRMPRRDRFGGGRRGFGPGFRPGFGPGSARGECFGPDAALGEDVARGGHPRHGGGFGHGGPHGTHTHGRRGGGKGGDRRAESAYERGFDAGFRRGQGS